MGYKTPKDGHSENAHWDGNRIPVTLVYDEENDAVKMLRSDTDGNLIVVGSVIDSDGNTIRLSGETQNNQNKLAVNSDNIEDGLSAILGELKILNFHISNITDMQVKREDLD